MSTHLAILIRSRQYLFDNDTLDVYSHLDDKATIKGVIHVFHTPPPRRKAVSYLYTESITYESSQEVDISSSDRAGIEKFVKLKGSDIIDYMAEHMFAPDIIGYKVVKKALLLTAASTNTDTAAKKINTALIGDPGLAKSLLLRKTIELVPNSRFESAQNSSGKSLTAIVEKEEESHVLRIGAIPSAKGGICALNELGRMNFDDQKHLLDVMQEQFFTVNKHGISCKIRSPTAIVASANPISGEWKNRETIDLDEFPALKPLIDRFDLIFPFKRDRDEQRIRDYADQKIDMDDRSLPNYIPYLQRHIEYSKRFKPKLCEEAKFMLKEYYIDIAKKHGSPRVLESLVAIAKMIARLKLKNIADTDDARETMEFYNAMLLPLQQVVNVSVSPRDRALTEFINVLSPNFRYYLRRLKGQQVKEMRRLVAI